MIDGKDLWKQYACLIIFKTVFVADAANSLESSKRIFNNYKKYDLNFYKWRIDGENSSPVAENKSRVKCWHQLRSLFNKRLNGTAEESERPSVGTIATITRKGKWKNGKCRCNQSPRSSQQYMRNSSAYISKINFCYLILYCCYILFKNY